MGLNQVCSGRGKKRFDIMLEKSRGHIMMGKGYFKDFEVYTEV